MTTLARHERRCSPWPDGRDRPVVTARAPAKINLQLRVGPLRPDGFHHVATIYHAVSLFDEVMVQPASRIRVRVEGADAGRVPGGRANLAARAAVALRRATGIGSGARILIRKRIPVAAGLAGGSADAAATLVACDSLWQTGLSDADLCELGAGLGSDVPAVLTGGTAVGLGRGERLTPVAVGGRYHWVLGTAGGGLSTPAVYAEYDRLRATARTAGDGSAGPAPRSSRRPGVSRELLGALRSGDVAAVGELLGNDLEAPAMSLRPPLRRALRAGHEQGAAGSIVSGSGPTCVFLAHDGEHARDLAAGLARAGVFRDVISAHGPVPGAVVTAHAA